VINSALVFSPRVLRGWVANPPFFLGEKEVNQWNQTLPSRGRQHPQSSWTDWPKRTLSGYLDQHEVIEGRYLLQVESPGAERPLYTARHFERFAGLKARVRSQEGNFTGRVGPVRGDEVEFVIEGGQTRSLKLGNFKANLAEWPDKPR
jgi:hypothetical protein